MHIVLTCSTRYLIVWLAFIVHFAVSGTAFAAAEHLVIAPLKDETQNVAPPPEQKEHSSLLVWRELEQPDLRHHAAVGTDASAKAGNASNGAFSRETGAGKSYLIPALEIPGFIILLNAFDRVAFPDKEKNGEKVYSATLSTTWEHFRRQNWTFDKDGFDVNQFGHPYEGATMFGLARSTGLNFWESFAYSNAGSFLWEMAGETTRPSINDLITTGTAGSLLGEALFRMAGFVLEDAGDSPGRWHKLATLAVSPPTAVNRYFFGDRFQNIYPSQRPATLWRLMAGGNFDLHANNLSPIASEHDANLVADFSMSYGLPGKPGYTYKRPLDYFDLELLMRSDVSNVLESVTLCGLLLGTDYHLGSDYRGIWGLYGSYDYISPHLYRVSSTALSVGTTAQYWIAPGVALQGSVLGGLGFGAAGTETASADERGYHYGATPQGLLSLSLLFGDVAMLDLSGRGYYVSTLGPDRSPGPEVVLRANVGVTFRVSGHHGIGIHYSESSRETRYKEMPHRYRSEGTVSVVYTFLSDTRFGAVEWRDGGS